jgi:hypothetical protein
MRSSPRTASLSNRLTLILAATSAVAVYLPSAAHAQTTVSWVGTTGNYVDPAQWSSGAAPTVAGDIDAVINNTGTALLSTGDSGEAAILVLGLQPGDSGNVSMADGTLNLGDLNVAGRSLLFDNATANAGGTGTFTQNGGVVNVLSTASPSATPQQSLYIANGGLTTGNSATGSYIMTAGQLNVGTPTSGVIIVGAGAGSSGSFIQSGGSVNLVGTAGSAGGIGTLQIANGGSTGSYSLSNTGSLTVNNGINVGGGAGSNGIFTQSGGTVTNNYNMNVAFAGATGSYSLSAGSLSVGTASGQFLSIGSGANSVGSFAQSGGAVTTWALNVGASTGTGSYSLTAGTLTTNGDMTVGGNTGTLSISGSSASLVTKGSLYIGSSGTATATLSSGTINIGTTTSQLLIIGNNAGSVGSFVQMPGTSIVDTGSLQLGRTNSAGNNTYDMQGGSLTLGNDSYIGGGVAQTAGNGTFSQAANTSITTAGSISVGIGGNTAGPVLTTATGVYNMNGGTLTITKAAGVFTLGNGPGAVGTFNQTAGTLSITGATSTVDIGRVGTGNTGRGTYNLSGTGVLNATALRTNTSTGNVINFSGGTSNIATLTLSAGAMNISGGTHTITGAMATGTSTLYISGGTFNFGSTINIGTGSTIRTSIDQTIPSTITLGSAKFQVDANALTINGPINIPASGRTLTKTGDGTLNINGAWIYNATPGIPVITTSAGTTNININLNGPTNIYASPTATVNLNTTQSVKTVTSTGGTFVVAPGGANTLMSTAIAISGGGSIDLTNNSLTLPSPTPANLITYLSSAYAGGSWTGTGLTSSTAKNRTDHTTGLGYSDNGTVVTVKYTFLGDLNLDGKVDADDYALIDRQVAKNGLGSPATWVTGDVNYDGVVNATDYMLMDTSFAHQSGGLSPEFLAQREAEFGPSYVAALTAAVPEPATLSLASLALTVLSARRRRCVTK